MKGLQQYLLPLLGMAVAVGAFIGLMALEMAYILPAHVSLPVESSETVPEWVTGFRIAEQEWILYPTLALVLIWFAFCWLKPSFESDNRTAWWVLWIIDAFAALVCIFLSKLEISIGLLPEVLTLCNAILLFWLATALFSPITHKFAPAGSSLARRFW